MAWEQCLIPHSAVFSVNVFSVYNTQLLKLLPKLSNLWTVMWWEGSRWSLFMDVETPAADKTVLATHSLPLLSSSSHQSVFSSSWSGLQFMWYLPSLISLISRPHFQAKSSLGMRLYLSVNHFNHSVCNYRLPAGSYTSRKKALLHAKKKKKKKKKSHKKESGNLEQQPFSCVLLTTHIISQWIIVLHFHSDYDWWGIQLM